MNHHTLIQEIHMNRLSKRDFPCRARAWCVLIFGALIYAVLFALGSQIDQTGATQLRTTVLRLLCALPAALAALLALFAFVLPACRFRAGSGKPLCTPLAAVLLFACYVPMFLIQYPGSFTYDIYPQALQAAGGSFSTFHPLVHTLFLRLCLNTANWTGSFEKSAALCSLIQMTLVSGLFAACCASIARSCSRRAGLLALTFFALHPAHMAFASTYTKDVLFSATFALLLCLCVEEMRTGHLKRRHRASQIVCGVLACLLRNNMIYALCAWLLILILCGRRFGRLSVCVLLMIACALGSNHLLVTITHAEKGPVREMLSIPAQQFARVRVLAPQSLTDDEIRRMDALFNQVSYDRYDPTIADPIKDRIDSEAFARDPAGAARLWLSIGAKQPGIYLDAFLNTALPALYPYAEYRVTPRYIEIGECRAGLTQFYGLEPIVQPRRFEAIRQWLNREIYDTGADHHPILRWLFNSGFIFWLLLAHLLYALYSRDSGTAIMMMLPVMLWGTFLLGPVMQGRYAYPFLCVLPLFLLRPRGNTRNTVI